MRGPRDIDEEISYFLPSERFAYLTSYTGAHPLGGAFHCEIYVANNIPVDQLLITEGSLLPVKPEDVATIDARFSPSVRFAVNVFLNDQEIMLSRLRP